MSAAAWRFARAAPVIAGAALALTACAPPVAEAPSYSTYTPPLMWQPPPADDPPSYSIPREPDPPVTHYTPPATTYSRPAAPYQPAPPVVVRAPEPAPAYRVIEPVPPAPDEPQPVDLFVRLVEIVSVVERFMSNELIAQARAAVGQLAKPLDAATGSSLIARARAMSETALVSTPSPVERVKVPMTCSSRGASYIAIFERRDHELRLVGHEFPQAGAAGGARQPARLPAPTAST